MRDGEQSPGASMTREEKVRIARQLERMRVDVIEAGFPAASHGDFEAVQAVAEHDQGQHRVRAGARQRATTSAAPARRSSRRSVRPHPHLHRHLARSTWRRSCAWSPTQVIEQAVKAVKWARQYTDDVEFSPEDAGRSDIDFLCRILEAVIEAGATTINIPDTVGYTMPEQFGELIRTLRERIPNSDKVVWSVHCHNDLGLAVANSLSAVHERRAPGGMHHQRPGRARRQRLAGGDRDGGAHAPGHLPLRHAHRHHADRAGEQAWSPASPASRCSRTRPSSAPTRSRTSPASTRTACSRAARPTRSCAPRTWAGARTSWCWASTPGRNAFKQPAAPSWASSSSPKRRSTPRSARFKDLADKKHEIFDEDLQALVSDEAVDARAGALQAGVA